MSIDGDQIVSKLSAAIQDLRSDLTKNHADLTSQISDVRGEHKAFNEALESLTTWRDETTKKLDGAVSSINILNDASKDFTRETNKIRQLEARLEKTEREVRNYKIQGEIERCDKELIMPKLGTSNRGEVFSAIQKNLSRVGDSLGFSPSLIGIKPMGPAIGCLIFPSSVMRERALNVFRQASPPIPVFVPTPGPKEFRDSLGPTKSFLYECKRGKLVETYKLSFMAVEGELSVQVGIRKVGKNFQFLTLKSSVLMSQNAAQEIYYKLISNWFSNESMPALKSAYDAQVAKLATPPPARPAPADVPAPGGASQVVSESVPDSVPAPDPQAAPSPAPQPNTCWSSRNEADTTPPSQAVSAMEEGEEGREEGELRDVEYPPLGEAKKRGRESRGSHNTPTKKQVEKKIRQGKSKSVSGSGSE